MDATQALAKINEIHQVIEGSNKAVFSGERMIMYGILLVLIPIIEFTTKGLTFGIDFGSQSALLITLLHTAFYWALFSLAGRVMPFKKENRAQHPLIQKAFSLSRPFMVAIIGVIVAFSLIQQFQLIHPVVFILLGLMFSLFGRFTIPAVSYIAWSYIALGFVYLYLTQFSIPHLWVYMVVYNGLSYIAMGLFLKKEQAA